MFMILIINASIISTGFHFTLLSLSIQTLISDCVCALSDFDRLTDFLKGEQINIQGR